VGWKEEAAKAKEAALHKTKEAVERAKESEAFADADMAAILDAAKEGSGITNRKGEVKKWKVAKAAMNPAGRGMDVAKSVGKEVYRQKRDADRSTDPEQRD